MGALLLQTEENFGQMFYRDLLAKTLGADGVILAETTLEGAAREKHGAAAPGAADAGFFPVVQCGPGSHYTGRSLAETSLNAAVNAAHAGAKLAMVNLFLKIG